MSRVEEKHVKTKITIESPTPLIEKGPNDEIDKPLLTFSINNPFKKILHWLDDIRKKQTTTFDLKIKVPLLALPIFLAVLGGAFQLFFSLGKSSGIKEELNKPTPTPVVVIKPTLPPQPVVLSRIGTIKATYQAHMVSSLDDGVISPSPVESSLSASLSVTPTVVEDPYRYILSGQGGQITFLVAESNISLNRYLNKRAYVTGLFDSRTQTLKISKLSDIEIIP